MNKWMDEAACATTDPELFFADEDAGWKQTATALKVCAGCTVVAQCLAASPADDRFSVRGGMTQRQRRRLRVNAA